MIHRLLDLWDERRARRGDGGKRVTDPLIDLQLAFPGVDLAPDIQTFGALAEQASADPAFFEPAMPMQGAIDWSEEWIRFPSNIRTEFEPNDTVHARIEPAADSRRALVVFHHWNAKSRSKQLARFFMERGITVVQIAMPHHLERGRPDAQNADGILSPSLGRTLRSMRQAVLDGRILVQLLLEAGYEHVSVLGMSLGSWVAGLIAAHDRTVKCAGLFLSADSLGEMVWTGRATQHIRSSFDGKVNLPELRRAWSPLDLGRHSAKLARDGLVLQLVLAKRDTVILPRLSERFLESLRAAGCSPHVLELNCGHYSLSLPPYGLLAGRSMVSAISSSDPSVS